MNLKHLLAACGVVVASAGSIFAQSSGSAADPISGTWTGNMGKNPNNRAAITVELKFDGKAAVTGAITGPNLSPGEITTGAFDSKTGALKLDITIKDAASSHAVFEGTIVEGTATGRVNLGNDTGSFKITKTRKDAQPGDAGQAAVALRKSFGEVSNWVTKAAELVPADKYSYRPAPSVRTFGQLIAHIADAHNFSCARAAGRSVEWSDPIEKGSTDKTTLTQKLKQSIDACNGAYGTGQAGPLIENVAHTNLHYGNIITYMRMLGLVPPSS